MYLPPHFKSDDPEIAAEVMRRHPFASLVSLDDSGFPFVSHLPLHLQQSDAGFTLLGHCARPNPHWRYLRERPQALVTFLEAHAYQSPRIYPDLERVPSWNYVAVHCKVTAEVIDDPADKDRILKTLIGDHEPAYAAQWRGLNEDFATKLLAGMVGFELKVDEWQCKLKLNQHRPEAHASMKAMYEAGNEHERELADWMQRLKLRGLSGAT